MWYGINIDKENKTENPEISPHICSHLLFGKVPVPLSGEMIVYNNRIGKAGYLLAKEWMWVLTLSNI